MMGHVIKLARKGFEMNCPKCHVKLDWLKNYTKAEKIYSFDGFDYTEIDEIIGGDGEEFVCPECDELLATDEKKAMEFLKA
jgi:predicted RNA-binding Zn-ribbon protein involved in translation (DUF1610 family)